MNASRPSLVLLLAAAAGCNNVRQDVIPNRILDRPLDVALGCYGVDARGTVIARELAACAQDVTPSCGDDDPETSQLLGFVANSERSELAMFRRCDQEAGIVDIDRDTPGYNMLPVGRLPSRVVAVNRGCTIVTANVGSCDLSIVDARGLAAFGLPEATEAAPSTLRADLVPLRGDGRPLAARPGDLLTLPDHLSSLGDSASVSTVCEDDGTDDAVLVTFPACHLVAEVSLSTQRILQSRQFVFGEDGSVEVRDPGLLPECPVECPGQPEAVPDAPIDVRGIYPLALAIDDRRQPGGAPPPEAGTDEYPQYDAFFVGGSESDRIFEIPILTGGRWAPPADTMQLALVERPQGVLVIRPTPIAPMGDGSQNRQFLYVIAGDGSTRVVQRTEDQETIGIECDTQIDPTELAGDAPSCVAIGERLRRPTANGPGIRSPDNSAITDWVFFATSGLGGGGVNLGGPPFQTADPQVVGVGVTSFGRVIYAAIDQFQQVGSFNGAIDPVGIMNVSMPAHSLWPAPLPNPPGAATEVELAALPRVHDEVPDRALPGPDDSTQALSPALRRIDLAYAAPADDDDESEQSQLNASLGQPNNDDVLGNRDGGAVYRNDVVRVVARDYQTWAAGGQGTDEQAWHLRWEGRIPGSQSGLGRIECEEPLGKRGDEGGWRGALCKSGAELHDDSAEFCDRGVLPGDVLTIIGCSTDGGCGEGQRCLRDPSAPGAANGICVSARAYEESLAELLVYCAPFLRGACGSSQREFRIRKAYRNRLELEPLPIARTAYLRAIERDDDPDVPVEYAGRYTCLPELAGEVPLACLERSDCEGEGAFEAGTVTCAVDGVCRACTRGDPECLECDEDADCTADYGPEEDGRVICSEGRCRRWCEEGTAECLRAPLPGAYCFPELVSYAVRLNESFLVEGDPAFSFFSDRVYAEGPEGECKVNPDVSPLLTSRIPLANPDGSATRHPDCDSGGNDNPCWIPNERETPALSRFHAFPYIADEGEVVVPAIRFSNPFMTLVLDLVNLDALGRTPPGFESSVGYGSAFATFERGRIPNNYRESFLMRTGYQPILEPIVVAGTTPLIYPVRIVKGPEPRRDDGASALPSAFIVDAGGRPGGAEIRGQIIRVVPSVVDVEQITDSTFRVR